MFLKRFFLAFLLIIFMFSNTVFADESVEEMFTDEYIQEIIETSSTVDTYPNINSKYAIVIEQNSKSVLFEKNSNKKVPMASTTKIMTAIIVIENSSLNQIVTVSKKAADTGGSRLGLKENDKITILDLLYGLLLCSGNDAAVQLAISIGGNVSNFTTLMNKKALELGLTNTNFVTPHGLDSSLHYTTAYELALITDYALSLKLFSKIVNTKSYSVLINNNRKLLTNTNELLRQFNRC